MFLPLFAYRYGVWADWSTPYVTLQPSYEAAQLEVFGKMVLNGHIYRGRKPVSEISVCVCVCVSE